MGVPETKEASAVLWPDIAEALGMTLRQLNYLRRKNVPGTPHTRDKEAWLAWQRKTGGADLLPDASSTPIADDADAVPSMSYYDTEVNGGRIDWANAVKRETLRKTLLDNKATKVAHARERGALVDRKEMVDRVSKALESAKDAMKSAVREYCNGDADLGGLGLQVEAAAVAGFDAAVQAMLHGTAHAE